MEQQDKLSYYIAFIPLAINRLIAWECFPHHAVLPLFNARKASKSMADLNFPSFQNLLVTSHTLHVVSLACLRYWHF